MCTVQCFQISLVFYASYETLNLHRNQNLGHMKSRDIWLSVSRQTNVNYHCFMILECIILINNHCFTAIKFCSVVLRCKNAQNVSKEVDKVTLTFFPNIRHCSSTFGWQGKSLRVRILVYS